MNTLEKEDKKQVNKDKLPFAVFLCPKADNDLEDYKQVFTEIISDRINDKLS